MARSKKITDTFQSSEKFPCDDLLECIRSSITIKSLCPVYFDEKQSGVIVILILDYNYGRFADDYDKIRTINGRVTFLSHVYKSVFIYLKQYPGIYPSSLTNVRFWTKIEFLNVVICRWGPRSAVSSATVSYWSNGRGSGGKAPETFWPFYI